MIAKVGRCNLIAYFSLSIFILSYLLLEGRVKNESLFFSLVNIFNYLIYSILYSAKSSFYRSNVSFVRSQFYRTLCQFVFNKI